MPFGLFESRVVRSKGPDSTSRPPVGRMFSAEGDVYGGGGVYVGGGMLRPLPIPLGSSVETGFGKGTAGPGVNRLLFTVDGPLTSGPTSGFPDPGPPPKRLSGPGSSLTSVNRSLLK